MGNLLERILVIPDTHFHIKNPSNRLKYVQEGLDTLDFISKLVDEKDISTVIFLGDVFDRGFISIDHKIFNEYYKRFYSLSETLGKKLFLLLGNHERTYSKNNPIFHWTDLGDRAEKLFYNREKFECKEALFFAPNYIEYENVYIEFNHFDKQGDYFHYRGDKESIALLHDNLNIPLKDVTIWSHENELIEVDKAMNYYNYIISGHVHIPQEELEYTNKRSTKIVYPGSMMARTTAELHQNVKLPIVEILKEEENGSYIKLESVIYKLPEFTETFDEEIVDENKAKYELRKTINNSKKILVSTKTLSDLLVEIEDERLKTLIRNSDNLESFEILDDIKTFCNKV